MRRLVFLLAMTAMYLWGVRAEVIDLRSSAIVGADTIRVDGEYEYTTGGVETSKRIVVADSVSAVITLNNVNLRPDGFEFANASPLELLGAASVELRLVGYNELNGHGNYGGTNDGYLFNDPSIAVPYGASLRIVGPDTLRFACTGYITGIEEAPHPGIGVKGVGGVIEIAGGYLESFPVLNVHESSGAALRGEVHVTGGTTNISSIEGSLTIDGGSVKLSGSYPAAVDSLGHAVYLNELTLPSDVPLGSFVEFSEVGAGFYGSVGVRMLGGKLYYWLPAVAEDEVLYVRIGDYEYYGSYDRSSGVVLPQLLALVEPFSVAVIEGAALLGEELSGSVGDYDGGALTYRWYRSPSDLVHTGTTYTPVYTDLGHELLLEVSSDEIGTRAIHSLPVRVGLGLLSESPALFVGGDGDTIVYDASPIDVHVPSLPVNAAAIWSSTAGVGTFSSPSRPYADTVTYTPSSDISGTVTLSASVGVRPLEVSTSAVWYWDPVDANVLHLGSGLYTVSGSASGVSIHTVEGTKIVFNGAVIDSLSLGGITHIGGSLVAEGAINGDYLHIDSGTLILPGLYGAVRIHGGSVKASPTLTASNAFGDRVYLNALTVGSTPVVSVSVSGVISDYDLRGVNTDDAGKVYLWLPSTVDSVWTRLSVGGNEYSNLYVRPSDTYAGVLYHLQSASVASIVGDALIGSILTSSLADYIANEGGTAATHEYTWYRSTSLSSGYTSTDVTTPTYVAGTVDFGSYLYASIVPIGSVGLPSAVVYSDTVRIGVRVSVVEGTAPADLHVLESLSIGSTSGQRDTVIYALSALPISGIPADTARLDAVHWSSSQSSGVFGITPSESTTYTPVLESGVGSIELTARLVKPFAPDIAWSSLSASSLVYGDALRLSQLSPVSDANGVFSWEDSLYVHGSATVATPLVRYTPSVESKFTYDYSNISSYTSAVSVSYAAAPLSITPRSSSKVYGEDDPSFSYIASGWRLSDTESLLGGYHPSRVVGEGVGAYAITEGSLPSLSNYAISFAGDPDTVLTICRARLVITPVVGQSKVYGELNPDYRHSISSENAVATENAPATIAGILSRVGDEQVVSSTPYTYYISALDSLRALVDYPNYYVTLASSSASFVILPRVIEITPDANLSKVYGGVDPVLTFGYEIVSDPVPGAGFAYVAPVFSGSLVRESGDSVSTYRILLGDVEESSGNYVVTLSGDPVYFSIEPRDLYITPLSASKVYGDVDPEFSYVVEGWAYDDVSLGLLSGYSPVRALSGVESGEDVGSYVIESGDLPVLSNYAITFNESSDTVLRILHASLEIVPVVGQSKVYGSIDPVDGYSHEVLGWRRGDLPVSLPTYLSRVIGDSVGTYPYVLSSSVPSYYGNYSVALSPSSSPVFSITPREVTITPESTTKVYGTPDPSIAYTYEVSTVDVDDAAAWSAFVGTPAYKAPVFEGNLGHDGSQGVGDHLLVLGDGFNELTGNYRISSVLPAAYLTIVPAPLYITPASGLSKVYGAVAPALDYASGAFTAAGFIEEYGDDASLLSGSLSLSVGDSVGLYSYGVIDPVSGDSSLFAGSNYELQVVGGSTFADSFAIVPRPIGIVGYEIAGSKVYDGTDSALVSGVAMLDPLEIVGDDDVELTSFSALYGDRHVGESKDVSISGMLSGVSSRNYVLSGVTPVTSSIIAKPVSIVGVVALPKDYDGGVYAESDESGAFISGLYAVDDVSIVSGSALYTSRHAGIRTVTFTDYELGGVDASNYVLSSQPEPVEVEIRPIPLSVSIPSISREYDGSSLISVSPVLSGVIGDDDVRLSAGVASFGDGAVGANKPVTLSGYVLVGVHSGNYIPVTMPVGVVGEIRARALTISPRDVVITYGSELPDIEFSYTGFVIGEDSAVLASHPVLVLPVNSDSSLLSVGEYELSLRGGSGINGNYDVVLGVGTLKVNPCALSSGDFSVTLPVVSGYDGLSRGATVLPSSGVVGIGEYAVYYRLLSSVATSATSVRPVDAGSYEVLVSAVSGLNYRSVSNLILDTLEIPKGTLSTLSVTFNSSTMSLVLPEGIGGLGEIAYKFAGSATIPTVVGSYAVTVDVTEGSNFYGISDWSVGNYVINETYHRILIDPGYLSLIDVSPESSVVSGGGFQFTVTPLSSDIEIEVLGIDGVGVVDRRLDGSYIVTISEVLSDISIQIEARSTASSAASLSSSVRVWSAGKELHIESDRVSDARIYSLSGILVESVSLSPGYPSVVRLGVGFYAISIEGRSYKVFIR